MKEYNELLFDAMCHAASGILANPQFSSFSYTDVAKSAIVAGKEIVKQYQAEVKKDDYVTDDGMRLDIGDKYYPLIHKNDEYHYEEKTVEEFTLAFQKMKSDVGVIVNWVTTIAIYGSKETAEKECSYRNEFLKAGIIKTDSK